jgi:hypothetical protein
MIIMKINVQFALRRADLAMPAYPCAATFFADMHAEFELMTVKTRQFAPE